MEGVLSNATVFKPDSCGAPRLDWDVLQAICDRLTDTSDILSFSCTGASLRPVAMQRFLSVRPIVLKDARSMCNIHSLIFADKTRRASHVRALQVATWDIGTSYDTRDVADRLLAILTCVDRLESFQTTGYLLRSKMSDTRILPAIVQLTTLREISVVSEGWEDEAIRLVQGVQSPLEIIHLDCLDFGYDYHSVHQVVTQHPALRSFIVDCAEGLPRLACLLQAFPALDRTLALEHQNDGRWWRLNDGLLHRVRDENRRAQESHCWVGLDYVSCEAHVFFALGLQCPIRHAKIIDCFALTKDYVATALRGSPPRQLTLRIELERGASVLDGLFPSELETTLTHLDVTFPRSRERVPRGLGLSQKRPMGPIFPHLPLRCLSISFYSCFTDYTDYYNLGRHLELSETFLHTVRNLPFEDVASGLASPHQIDMKKKAQTKKNS
ncbi:hypothetical protein DICSQDRAFT_175080 [Dichomitus squalens LYAD-421 SS1]|uniref:F-box domain-containing protein n=1 Tax=Dichomitus squalens (strain LYAD-421) TaxID=732165 RepID=R7SML8_DICSQ|nr:uncharacterized protein DICSQDRAFT_175080 [Dichomitus squalens LYAD-421 SS1]EJF56227.1 hypothetical protein DICSQDRAFT_175080 [Dichomitus squalens LYAD-421 SS1]